MVQQVMVNISGNSNLHLSFTFAFPMHLQTRNHQGHQWVLADVTFTGKVEIITGKIEIITGIIPLLLRFTFHRNRTIV